MPLLGAGLLAGPAAAQNPITIGFGMALLAMQIWEADTNTHGGLLGRPVKLVYYDDQSNPSSVPGIYTKLLDVDKVDIVVSGYATNMIAPAMPRSTISWWRGRSVRVARRRSPR